MNLLLDTHTFIWMLEAPEKLSSRVIEAYQDPTNTLLVSVASLWEIQIKTASGKLEMDITLEEIVRHQLDTRQYQLLDIRAPHVLDLANLPRIHGDPFDRILLAQSRVEGYALASVDGVFDQYGIERFW